MTNKEESRLAAEDREFWNRVGKSLGLTMFGWTDRYHATFFCDGHTVQIEGWLADKILALAAKADGER